MNCLHLHGELSKHIKGTSCRNIFVTELKLKIPSIISHSNFNVKLFWLNYSITMTLFKIFFIIQLGLMIQAMYLKSVKNAFFHKNKWKFFFFFCFGIFIPFSHLSFNIHLTEQQLSTLWLYRPGVKPHTYNLHGS